MRMQREREQVIEYCLRMAGDGLTVGTSGNISVRAGDSIAITPSGVEYTELSPVDVCVVDLDGSTIEGELRPSSEIPMHTVVYRDTAASSVVHSHPLYATAVSLLCDEVPTVHYMLAILGDSIPVTRYAPFGSDELAERSAQVLRDRGGVILGNHGATTVGADLSEAYTRSLYLEWCCRLWCTAAGLGDPRLLTAAQMAEAHELIAGYGQPSDTAGA